MTHNSHVVFVVPDGVGIKNYLYSDLLKHVNKIAKVTIWSTLPESAFNEVKVLHQDIDIHYKNLKLHPESIVTRLFREASTFARLHFNAKTTQNDTILMNWRRQKGNLKLGLLYRLAEYIGKWATNNYDRILKLERLSKAYWSEKIINKYQVELENLKADSIFITHQRVAGLMPICIASKKLNIKSTTAIFSWDNLPKARLCVTTDYYILWSSWMKNDIEIFYPEIKDAQIKVTGTPQFEFYAQERRLVSRDSFAKIHGLNPHCKWICFSGDDEYTSPYDPNYLNDIAEGIAKLDNKVQLIFRRCPVDFSSRYDEVLQKHKDIIIAIDPLWHTDSKAWVGYFSKLDDVDLQVNLSHHCEGVINLGSTMALDFATLNKPCLYLNYDTVNDNNWSTEYIYRFHHFRSMEGLDAVGWINSKEEITSVVASILADNSVVGKDRKLWLEKLVLCPIDENNNKIAKTII